MSATIQLTFFLVFFSFFFNLKTLTVLSSLPEVEQNENPFSHATKDPEL